MILLQQAFFSVAEPLLNKALAYDALSKAKLTKLEGKVFAVQLMDLPISFCMKVFNGKLLLSSYQTESDCSIKVSSSQLNNIADAAQLTRMIKQDQLELDGDLSIAQAYSDLLMDNNIDWQELLSKYVGDGMAHRISQMLLNVKQLIQNKLTDMDFTISNLVTDEIKVSPNPIEVNDFIDSVDVLQSRTDKLDSLLADIKNTRLKGRL